MTDGRGMNRRDTVRLLLALDTLDAPPSDPIRLRIEAILIKARVHAEQLERETLRTRATAN